MNNILLIKLGSSYVIEKEGTGKAREIVRMVGEDRDEYLRRVKKIFKDVCDLEKEFKGKRIE